MRNVGIYRDLVNGYNGTIERFQRYIRGDAIRDEADYDFYNLMLAFNIPHKSDKESLINYMDFYGLKWEDLNWNAFGHFGAGQDRAAVRMGYNFASSNIRKLYKNR